MQVAVNARFLIPNRLEGIGRYSFELLSRLAVNNPEVQFHLLFDRPFSEEFLPAPNMKGHCLRPQARHPWLWYWHYEVQITRWLQKNPVDVYWGPDAFLAKSSEGTRSLMTIHDLAWEHNAHWNSSRVSKFYAQWVPQYCDRADHIISISKATTNDLVNRYGISEKKISTIYHGLEANFATGLVEWQKIPLFNPYFLVLGSINPRKNSHRLLKAFQAYRETHGGQMHIVFAGELGKGWSSQEYRFIQDCFRRSDVHYLGNVSEREKKALLYNAKGLLYPSLLEGFGLVLLEAAQFKCPILTSKLTVCEEVASHFTNNHGVVYIDPTSHEGLVKGLQALEQTTDGPSVRVQRSWDDVARETWEVILGVLS